MRSIRIAVSVTALALSAYLNLRNWCQPGWCGRFGFPLTYRTWSDSFGTFNGQPYGLPSFSWSALAINIAIALAVAWAALRWPIRRLENHAA